MNLNCKVGDLAVIVKSAYGNLWKIVEVIASSNGNGLPNGTEFIEADGERWTQDDAGEHYWFVECRSGELFASNSKSYKCRPIADCALRPLRDTDGQDETLTWAGLPKKEKVK